MCLYLTSYLCLSLLYRLFMFFTDILINFKRLSQLLRSFAKIIFSEFAQIGSLPYKIRAIIYTVHDNMKKRNCTTSIFCILFHKEDVFCNFIIFKGKCLFFFILSLKLVYLVKKDQP